MGLKPSDTPSSLDSGVIKTPNAEIAQPTVDVSKSTSTSTDAGILGGGEGRLEKSSPEKDSTSQSENDSNISHNQNADAISVSPTLDFSSGNTMSTSSSSLSSNIQAPTNAQRPGERLRQARLFKQRELKEIASELNIPERILIAIEADEYKSLPEPAFIRGYLRSYARLLGVDSDILITQFNEIYTSATGLSSNHSLENSPLQQLAKLQSKTRKSKRWMLWLLIPIGLVILFLILRPIVKRVVDSPAVTNGETPTVTLSENMHTGQGGVANIITSPTSQPLSALPSPAVSANDQLVLTFSKSSDATVEDATGKTLASGTHGTGEPLTLSGVSPFSITLEDAASVSLTLNGEHVDLKPTADGRAVFRLSR